MISPMRARVLAQKSEEATASSASLLARPWSAANMLYKIQAYIHLHIPSVFHGHYRDILQYQYSVVYRYSVLKQLRSMHGRDL